MTVVPVERFGEDTDQLWQRASAGYDFALVRDSSYLKLALLRLATRSGSRSGTARRWVSW